jgi:hypothetical protein
VRHGRQLAADRLNGEHNCLISHDDREITWKEFGRMLMSFESWQFKLEIRDKSEKF